MLNSQSPQFLPKQNEARADADFMTASWPGARAWSSDVKSAAKVVLKIGSSLGAWEVTCLRRLYPCFDLCQRRPVCGQYRRTAWLGNLEGPERRSLQFSTVSTATQTDSSTVPLPLSLRCSIFSSQGFTIAFASCQLLRREEPVQNLNAALCF